MNDLPQTQESTVTANVSFGAGPWHFKTKVTVSTEPTRLRQLIPLVQVLSNSMVDAVSKDVERQGHPVSCKKGCGACCRQLVPISPVEARYIADLVDRMPEPRRTEIRARFAEALRRLDEAGILEKLRQRNEWVGEVYRPIGNDYFHLGIPCPFLEDESCSIHPDRPVSCREYLVTSPAEHCAQPIDNAVRTIDFPFKMWWALARFDPPLADARFIPWVPLVLAPEWTASHPDDAPAVPGPELMSQLFGKLTGKDAPPLPAFA